MHSLPPPFLTVIIPALNEAQILPALIDDLQRQQGIDCEIIVGDGGSLDATQVVAETFGAQWVPAPSGRGAQMNAAARQANGEYYLFLHADSRLEDPLLLRNALRALQHAATENFRVAGHFPLRFNRATNNNPLAYRYLEEKTACNRAGTINGDQGLLLSQEFFRQLGGFEEALPFLEDQGIAEKIRDQGVWMVLPGTLQTSARRFEAEGFHRRYLLMSMMMGLYHVGMHSFFVRAPGVYRAQQDTAKLLLSPFFSRIWRMIRKEWGLRGSIRTFYRLGRYIRQNSWQLFFFFDVWFRPLLGAGRYPCLKVHDRVIAPCIDFAIVHALIGTLCFVWYMGLLAPFFWLNEAQEHKPDITPSNSMKPSGNTTVVALFVRVPVPGRVKTRLAEGLGEDGACRLYQAMVADSLRNIQAGAFPLYLFYDDAEQSALPAAWVGAASKVIAQQGEGIGARMAAAFEHCFAEGIEQVVLVGSDIPGLDAERIATAAAALASNDAAITPVEDGGYCLIALQRGRYRRQIFEEIPWSTEQVLQVTLERFEECGLSVSLQETMHDIDTLNDLEKYCRRPSAKALATNKVILQLRAEGSLFFEKGQ